MVRVAIVLLLLMVLPSAAQAEKRIALLIGNKDYKAGVGALANPLNDIRVVGDALRAVGFEVLKPAQNVRRADLLLAVHDFAARLKAAGSDAVGFLYYSGHGIASAGENYLIPIDVDEPSTVQLSVQGVKHSEVLAILRNEAPNAAHYLVLDACRNTLQGARGAKGFVPIRQQSGVLVAFSTEPGKTASDIGQSSGPYAAALAAELVKPGQNDLLMFHNVRVAVIEKTRGDQVPWTEDGIQRRQRVTFGGEIKPRPDAAPPAASDHPKGVFDGAWIIHRIGPSCPHPDTRIAIVIDNSVASGRAGGGTLKGSVSKGGALSFSHPTSQDVRQAVNYSGTLRGTTGQGTFKGSGSCQGSFTAERTPPVAPTPMPEVSEAAREWARLDKTSVAELETFVRRYDLSPEGDYARWRIDNLKQQAAGGTASSGRPAAPAKARCDGGVETLVGNERLCLRPREVFKDCPECPEMVVIPSGEFTMGSPPNEESRESDEGPQRKVTIGKPFAAGRFEVTFAEWDTCVATDGCKHKPSDQGWGKGRRPVINVSWDDAKQYVSWLGKKTGRPYRLLSEAEWEYAVRAGTMTAFSTGRTITTDQANFNGDYTYGGSPKGVYRAKTIEVGSLNRANAFGLHDMHGNVWEWVEDCYQDGYSGAATDGSAWLGADCTSHGARGGSWINDPRHLRSANRYWMGNPIPVYAVGFRVARTLD